ncbi:MAG: exonuclease domain-containing protein [Akkermansiaceae bacterium]|nr:exonuclease domain-containing protein [Akkermansiaceae bacterium]
MSSKLMYCVLDFEANCSGKDSQDHEIIEFPAVLVDAQSGRTISEFRQFVRTIHSGKVSPFIRDLTSITDEDLGRGVVWSDPSGEGGAVELFASWCGEHSVCADNTTMVLCGDWDLKTMLPRQVKISQQQLPPDVAALFSSWCNIKRVFAMWQDDCKAVGGSRTSGAQGGAGNSGTSTKQRGRSPGMAEMLVALGLELEGHHHCGIDDCRNIAKIARALMARGHDVTVVNSTGSR